MHLNPILLTDFYKIAHIDMYPPGTEMVYSNLTPRSSRIDGVDHVVVFGIQYFIKEFLIKRFNEDFFNRPKEEIIEEYRRVVKNAIGSARTDHIEALHDLGYLPIEIKALPEGSLCPLKVPVLTIKNTHKDFFWLVNYLETLLSNTIWHPLTVATIAHQYKKMLTRYAHATSDDLEFVNFQGHDFSMRGQTSIMSSAAAGAAHALSFKGGDTIPTISFLEEYYGASEGESPIFSVAASEHSCTCLSSAVYDEEEFEFFRRMITQVYPSGIVSLVSDSYDYWATITDYLPRLREEILSRDGTVVVRGDSGDPVDIICGVEYDKFDSLGMAVSVCSQKLERQAIDLYDDYNDNFRFCHSDHWHNVQVGDNYYKINISQRGSDQWEVVDEKVVDRSPAEKGTVELLYEIFGGSENNKGYIELDSHIRAIYGDGITFERASEIIRRLRKKGFASTNVILGIGSYTYQHLTRDELGLAVKCTAAIVNGKLYEVYKDPKTDNGTKKSARGLLAVLATDKGRDIRLVESVNETIEKSNWNCLRTVFLDGKIVKEHTLSEIRERLERKLW